MTVLTNGVNTKDWIEVSKCWHINAYFPGSTLDDLTEGLSSKEIIEQEQILGKDDLEKAQKKVIC